jgi:hypothetical protein
MRPSWNYYVRLVAAVVVVACMFLPVSTCTHRGRTTVTVPIHDESPTALILLVYCGALALVIAEGFRPRMSTSGFVLVVLQLPASVFFAFEIYLLALFGTPAIGWYVALGALSAIFATALIEVVLRARMRRRAKNVPPSVDLPAWTSDASSNSSS